MMNASLGPRSWPFLPYLLVLPAVAVLCIFTVYPAGMSLYLSFFDVAPFTGETFFVGLAQYRDLLSSSDYIHSVIVTILFALLTVPVAVTLSLLCAVGLDQNPYVHGLFRTVFLLPVGISPAMAAMLWIFLFNPTAGYLNYFLESLGLSGPHWLSDPHWALVAVALTSIWKEVGFNVIFFLAGLGAISPDVVEAAIVDGAGFWRRFYAIILPLLAPTLFFVVVVSVIHAFESFGQIHILTRGGPADATNVLVYQLYRDAFEYFRAGYASAQAVLLFLVILLFTALQFRIAKQRAQA